VDSVAEHQPASSKAYYQYLQNTYILYPFGLIILMVQFPRDSSSFLILYAVIAYYFSAKMTRLILLLGPIASCLGSIMVIRTSSWIYAQFSAALDWWGDDDEDKETETKEKGEEPAPRTHKGRKGKKGKQKKQEPALRYNKKRKGRKTKKVRGSATDELKQQLVDLYEDESSRVPRVIGALMGALFLFQAGTSFYSYCWAMSPRLSHPSLMYKATGYNGQPIMVDDYREAYWWLRDNTPKESRVMAWWDYGYQITGIAERTTIADGNTWNHEHIGLLGRCMVSPPEVSHKIVRHIADYILIWTGGGGDDLAKSPHMARISNSVFSFICPNDPTCQQFGFTNNDRTKPTKMMRNSLIYNMHQHGQGDVELNPELYREVYKSKYGKVRIFKVRKRSKKSLEWVANPDNRECDAPGSWYCTGKYPPALQEYLDERKDFQQLEDFNVEKDEHHEKYQQEYMNKMRQKHGG